MTTRQTCNFDFADPRMPRGADARIDRQATQMGVAGPASPLPNRGPTASEIRSAKAEAVGGARKRCTKGKNCSATCIAQIDDCLVDFPEPVQNEIRKMVGYLMKKGGIEEGSQRDVELGRAAILAGQHLTKGSASGKDKIFGTTAPGQSRLLTALEIADLKANRDRLGNAEFDQKVRQAFQKDVFSRGVNLNKKDLELLYESLPQSAKLQLNNSGNPGKGKWFGTDKEGNEVTTANNGSKARGLAVFDMFFKQGGTDAYGSSNRIFSPADFDVEHMRPVSKGGLDHPSNWVLARSGAQRQRADTELKKWIDSLPDPRDKKALKDYYSAAAKKGRAKDALKKTLASLDPKTLSDADLIKISPSNMKYLFNRDSFFVSGLYGLGTGGRLTNTQPAVFGRAYGLARKYLSEEDVAAIRSDVKKVWNKQWMENDGSTKDMVKDYIKIYKNRLPPEAFKLLEPEIVKWGSDILSKYPEKSPRASQ
jgi:hypothetical protein